MDPGAGAFPSLPRNYRAINANAQSVVTLSLRAIEGSAAISMQQKRLLRRYAPRNDTLSSAYVIEYIYYLEDFDGGQDGHGHEAMAVRSNHQVWKL